VNRIRGLVLVTLAASLPAPAVAQARLFRSDSVLAFTLRTDFRALGRDRDTADSPWREATITWAGTDGPRTAALRVRTRGAFRLRRCNLPPIRLRFVNDSVRGTPWRDLHRPKLVTHCENRDEYEQNVLKEYALYLVLRLFTPLSYSSRLVRVTYEDASGAAQPVTRYGFVLEDPEEFAERMRATPITRQGVRQGEVEAGNAALLGVFEYFIANTDWSVPGLHNVALMTVDSVVRAVPYDFDWAGAIDARYARPDPRLPIRSVRERHYRGLCLSADDLEPTLARFEALRDSVAAVYRRIPGLEARTVERTLTWYGEFYREIADRRRWIQRIRGSCFGQ
jgi:hypothetical protein